VQASVESVVVVVQRVYEWRWAEPWKEVRNNRQTLDGIILSERRLRVKTNVFLGY